MACVTNLSFSHFGIFSTDPDTLGDFYVRVLGFTITDTGTLPSGALVFLSRDPEEHHQLILCSGRPEGSFNTVNQISLRCGDGLAGLRAIFAAASAEEGVTEVLPVSHGNAISLYFKDPEGNRVEVFVDAPFYCEQPQRIAVDLAEDDATIWAKVEDHAKSQPKFQPRAVWVAAMRAKMDAQRAAAVAAREAAK
tara:strand:+ start:927 stop:1508 length:582 start_codon:yes stop_codon:yes gene_type:complete